MTSEDRFTIFLRGLAGLLLVGIAIAYGGRGDWLPVGIFGAGGLFWLWLTYRTYQKGKNVPPTDNRSTPRQR
jgi:hypothetical protein